MTETKIPAYAPRSLAEQASLLFANLGYTLEEAVELFFSETLSRGSLPFDVSERVPNAETQAVFDEVEDMIAGRIPKPRSQSVREMFEEMRINGEI